MTAQEAITRADALLPNPIETAEKLRWLEALDGQLLRELAALRGGEAADVAYTASSRLVAEAPWDELYVHWLQAKALYFLAEYGRYQNAMSQFNSLYLGWTAAQIRAEKPKPAPPMRY